jgi:hypothetical protein
LLWTGIKIIKKKPDERLPMQRTITISGKSAWTMLNTGRLPTVGIVPSWAVVAEMLFEMGIVFGGFPPQFHNYTNG